VWIQTRWDSSLFWSGDGANRRVESARSTGKKLKPIPGQFRAGVEAATSLDDRVDSPSPILDAKLADQWFAEGDATDQALDRTMVSALRTDVAPRLALLQSSAGTITPKDAVHELHKLRGAVASFGFSASARHLERLEHNWLQLTPDARVTGLTAAHETFVAGLDELLRRFPHLGTP
jgi:hypothetical protein